MQHYIHTNFKPHYKANTTVLKLIML